MIRAFDGLQKIVGHVFAACYTVANIVFNTLAAHLVRTLLALAQRLHRRRFFHAYATRRRYARHYGLVFVELGIFTGAFDCRVVGATKVVVQWLKCRVSPTGEEERCLSSHHLDYYYYYYYTTIIKITQHII